MRYEVSKRLNCNFKQAIIDVCNEMFAIENVTAEDNFFVLGGTSLNVIELIELLLSRYHIALPLDVVFASETLTELAEHCSYVDEPSLIVPGEDR